MDGVGGCEKFLCVLRQCTGSEQTDEENELANSRLPTRYPLNTCKKHDIKESIILMKDCRFFLMSMAVIRVGCSATFMCLLVCSFFHTSSQKPMQLDHQTWHNTGHHESRKPIYSGVKTVLAYFFNNNNNNRDLYSGIRSNFKGTGARQCLSEQRKERKPWRRGNVFSLDFKTATESPLRTVFSTLTSAGIFQLLTVITLPLLTSTRIFARLLCLIQTTNNKPIRLNCRHLPPSPP